MIIIFELLLKVVLLAMEGQPPDVRAEFWRMYLADVREARAFFKLPPAAPPPPVPPPIKVK